MSLRGFIRWYISTRKRGKFTSKYKLKGETIKVELKDESIQKEKHAKRTAKNKNNK